MCVCVYGCMCVCMCERNLCAYPSMRQTFPRVALKMSWSWFMPHSQVSYPNCIPGGRTGLLCCGLLQPVLSCALWPPRWRHPHQGRHSSRPSPDAVGRLHGARRAACRKYAASLCYNVSFCTCQVRLGAARSRVFSPVSWQCPSFWFEGIDARFWVWLVNLVFARRVFWLSSSKLCSMH